VTARPEPNVAALARANTAQAELLHDAMDALDRVGTHDFGVDGFHNEVICRTCALLARFRALTGADT
jgi:hypothetical protein